MSQDLWYYSRDGEEKMGPTPGDHLRQWISAGQLTGEILVWHPGMDDWMPIENVVELRDAIPGSATQQTAAKAHDQDTQLVRLVVGLGKLVAGLGKLVVGRGKTRYSRETLRKVVVSKFFVFSLTVPFPTIKFIIAPAIVSNAASTVVDEKYGIDMSVEDWSVSLLDLGATANNVVISIPGPYGKTEFLSAEVIEVDLSLWHGIKENNWVRTIEIKEPELYVERLLSGRWNWHDLMAESFLPKVRVVKKDPESNPKGDSTDSGPELEGYSFSLSGLTVEKMGLEWVENLPGDSRSGMIQDLKTRLFIDDISVRAKSLVGLVDPRSGRNSLLNLEARTGSGKISFTGRANLFSWGATQERKLAWMPTMEGKIYLENVGTNALARLMPDTTIVPEGGTISGTIDLEVFERQVDCQANLNIRNATFTANQTSHFVAANDTSKINEALSGYRADGQYQFSCGGRMGEGAYRPFQAFQTNVILQGVKDAPEVVRALAAVEHTRYSEDPIDSSLENEVEKIRAHLDPEWLDWLKRAKKSGLGRFRRR